jgi:hypothetical protein
VRAFSCCITRRGARLEGRLPVEIPA